MNNAGIDWNSDIDIARMTMIQKIIEVNQIGMVRVTKAFLPHIKRKQGKST